MVEIEGCPFPLRDCKCDVLPKRPTCLAPLEDCKCEPQELPTDDEEYIDWVQRNLEEEPDEKR